MDHLEEFFAKKAKAVMHRFSFKAFKKSHKTLLSAIISFGKETSSEIIWRDNNDGTYTSIIGDYELLATYTEDVGGAWLIKFNKFIVVMWNDSSGKKPEKLNESLGQCASAYYEHRSKNVNYEKHLIIR